MAPKPKTVRRPQRLSKSKLNAMAEEAIVDCHDEEEAAMGWFNLMEEHLKLPFDTRVLGVDVTVENITMNDRNDITALCTRDGKRQAICVLDLPLPSPPPAGAEWIEAYRHWTGSR